MFYFNKYKHSFGIARTNKKENNFLTTLNYQYIQSNNFTEESIKSLADFSVDWIKKIMTGDKLYTMLFLVGCHDEDKEIYQIENGLNSDIAKVLMYNDSILNDEYVRQKINQMIDKKINQMKIGKLYVEGDYSFLIPDLYALCQHAFGMEVTGLLPAKYTYVKRWIDSKSDMISMQRSPLVAPGENRTRKIIYDEKCNDWFRFIESGIILSIWDLDIISMSDADKLLLSLYMVMCTENVVNHKYGCILLSMLTAKAKSNIDMLMFVPSFLIVNLLD